MGKHSKAGRKKEDAMIQNFASTSIWSEDLNNLLPFYRDVLGLKPTMESPRFVVFGDLTGTTFGLGSHSEIKGKSKEPARHMVGFTTDDIQGDVKRLKAKGVEFIEEPTRQGESNFWIATCTDPEGNYVQLFEGTP
jgi:predicted enzyme related to lactoylglutathione lyase